VYTGYAKAKKEQVKKKLISLAAAHPMLSFMQKVFAFTGTLKTHCTMSKM
jgi:hypothetical protein